MKFILSILYKYLRSKALRKLVNLWTSKGIDHEVYPVNFMCRSKDQVVEKAYKSLNNKMNLSQNRSMLHSKEDHEVKMEINI